MMEPLNLGSQNRGSRPRKLLLLLLVGLALLALPVLAQSQSQVESAARAKVPKAPNSAWGMNGSESQGSTQPRVLFEDGQLTIDASNATLADVLYALRACTGADIDLPSTAGSERVTAQLGPGPARKVLSDLLTWSSFDYVIQASDSDPLSIQSVTLMIRTKSAPATVAGPPGRPATASARPVVEPSAPAAAPVDVPEVDKPVDAPPSPSAPAADNSAPLSPSSPSQPRPADMSPVGSGGSSSSGGAKSPADMIQELQQMYQQRRTLQEQQNRGAVPPQGSSQ
jgi:hypothetical protein